MKKLFRILGIAAVALLSSFALFSFSHISTSHAAGTAPVIGFSPAWDFNNGKINGGHWSISPSSGPFTEDFRVELCLNQTNGTAFCSFTPWASDAADKGLSQAADSHDVPEYTSANGLTWWSTWSGENSFLPTSANVNVQTKALPAGEVINNVQLGIQFIENNAGNQTNGPQCLSVIGGGQLPEYPADSSAGINQVAHPDSAEYTPIGGGVSADAYGWTHGNCGDPAALSDTPEYYRIYMAADTYNTAAGSNNIPASTLVSQVLTTDSSGNPLEITVKNTGAMPWVSDQSTVTGVISGTCDGLGGREPLDTHPQGTQCTVSLDNHSSVLLLKHISGSPIPSFVVTSNSAMYSQPTRQTCTVDSGSCSNPSCTDSFSCTLVNGACSNGGTTSFGISCNVSQSVCEGSGAGGCSAVWTDGCNATWNKVSCTTAGDPNIEPDASAVFKLSSMAAPVMPSLYTENWQMIDNSNNGVGNFGAVIPISIQVGPVVLPSNASITVLSENSINRSVFVPANWAFNTTALTDPCTLAGNTCTNAYHQDYLGLGYGTYQLANISLSSLGANGGPYSLRSTQFIHPSIAKEAKTPLDAFFALGKDLLIPEAHAQSFDLSYMGSGVLSAGNTYAKMVILWDPESVLNVNGKTTSSLTPGAPTDSITLSNTGAPGASTNWNATTTPGTSSWLTLSSLSGTVAQGGAPQTITITATPPAIPNTYTATITFCDPTTPCQDSPSLTNLDPNKGQIPAPINVTLIVLPPVPPAVQSVVPTCNPPIVVTGATSACSAIVKPAGAGQAVTWANPNIGMITQTGPLTATFTAPGNSGTAHIIATSVQVPSKSGQYDVTVIPSCPGGGGCPVCNSFSANPGTIAVPGSSNLKFDCVTVTSCNITPGNIPVAAVGGAANGTVSVSPTSTTSYDLTCTSPNGGQTTANATVVVGNPRLCETAPNTPGCH